MKKLLIFLGVTLGFISCDDNISELNVDPKNPLTIHADPLFTNGQYSLVNQMVNIDYNHNVDRFWANYYTQTTYIQEASYDAANRDIGGSIWDNIYTETLYEFKRAKEILRAEDILEEDQAAQNNRIAIVKIHEVYAWQYLVDNFGNIPFREALDPKNITPAYDDDEFIYNAITDSLQDAIATLDHGAGSFGSADLIYGGDVAQWEKFANSLLLKIGLRIADFNSTKADELVDAAVAGGVFDSNADNADFPFIATQPYTNPIYDYFEVDSRASDFVLTQNFIDLLEDLEDPRTLEYIENPITFGYPTNETTGAKEDSTITRNDGLFLFYDDVSGNDSIVYVETPFTIEADDSVFVVERNLRVLKGGKYGAAGNAFNALSHPTATIVDPEFPGTILDYATVEFMLAEAVERGYIAGDASEHYENAIRASFEFWGLSEAEADAYLLQPDVAYATASGDWREKIGRQKYIALYNQGHEAWTEARRLGFPDLVVAASNDVPNPHRMIYPVEEVLINRESYDAALAEQGEDDTASPIFWDVVD